MPSLLVRWTSTSSSAEEEGKKETTPRLSIGRLFEQVADHDQHLQPTALLQQSAKTSCQPWTGPDRLLKMLTKKN